MCQFDRRRDLLLGFMLHDFLQCRAGREVRADMEEVAPATLEDRAEIGAEGVLARELHR